MGFKKELGFWDLLVYGIGIIVGAGIYVLIAPGAALAGNALWISFLLATLVASFTAFSYAVLSSRYSFEAAEYFLVKKLTKHKLFPFLTAWLVFTAQIVAIAAVSIGFAQYFQAFLPSNALLVASILVIFSMLINLLEVKEISKLNFLLTSLAVLGLLLVILAGIVKGKSFDYVKMKSFHGLFKSTALIFFSFIGFESIVNLGGESKEAKKQIPKAIVLSVVITGIIYTLVAVSSLSLITADKLSQSDAPLVLVASKSFGSLGFWIVELAALFSTASTVLILTMTTSRIIWGLAKENWLPFILSSTKNSVPYIAVIFSSLVSIALVILLKKVSVIAEIANFNMLIVYLLFNFLAFNNLKSKKRYISLLGIFFVLFTLVYLKKVSLLVGVTNLLIGLFFYRIAYEKSGNR